MVFRMPGGLGARTEDVLHGDEGIGEVFGKEHKEQRLARSARAELLVAAHDHVIVAAGHQRPCYASQGAVLHACAR